MTTDTQTSRIKEFKELFERVLSYNIDHLTSVEIKDSSVTYHWQKDVEIEFTIPFNFPITNEKSERFITRKYRIIDIT